MLIQFLYMEVLNHPCIKESFYSTVNFNPCRTLSGTMQYQVSCDAKFQWCNSFGESLYKVVARKLLLPRMILESYVLHLKGIIDEFNSFLESSPTRIWDM